MSRSTIALVLHLALTASVSAHARLHEQDSGLPNSYPQVYPNAPSGPLNTEWQSYYQVTDPLPNITFPLPRNWAGNIPVDRPTHPNNTLFFWAWETSNGSLTSTQNDNPYFIWLNGGPGTSSMLGVLLEHGPIRLQNDGSLISNNNSWHQLGDIIYIDQPVGTGYSTADSDGYVADENDVADDFLGFLTNLVAIFPNLASRPLYLTGESYAGTYIPYIAKALFSTSQPPVKLGKIAIGDPKLGSIAASIELPALSVIETYPQLIGYDETVYEYFLTQHNLCGYNISLTYPTQSSFPDLKVTMPVDAQSPLHDVSHALLDLAGKKSYFKTKQDAALNASLSLDRRALSVRAENGRRSIINRPNGTIDPYYGCLLYEEMWDYAFNFSYPWTVGGPVNVYDVPDALFPEVPTDTGNQDSNAGNFMNDDNVRTALHAPTSKDWIEEFTYPWGNEANGGDPSVEPAAFLSNLASNASSQGISLIFYSGNDDSITPHRGTELTIQNMTFGGTMGFTQMPSTSWYDDDGNFAGLVHQERNVTYVLFDRAGHMVPYWQPAAAFTFAREFIKGTNSTGLLVVNAVENSGSTSTSVVGGTNTATGIATGLLPGQPGIFFGSGATQSTAFAPAATIAVWTSVVGPAATPTTPAQSSAAAAAGKKSASVRVSSSWRWLGTGVAIAFAVVHVL